MALWRVLLPLCRRANSPTPNFSQPRHAGRPPFHHAHPPPPAPRSCPLASRISPPRARPRARSDAPASAYAGVLPAVLGGVLFNDSADKGARFIWLCDAFEIPLLFLADVPGLMIGTDVERRGIIRHGAKMISAVSETTVPKISVIVRKAYGAGLYTMSGPAFESDSVIALPSAQIAVMGPEPAVNAVFFNKLADLPEEERAARRRQLEDEYRDDVDL